MTELRTLMTGLSFGESPRWHDDRLWFSDWGAEELIAVDLDGNSEVIVRVPSFPFCIDWLPDGRLLIVSARARALLTIDSEGALATYADLTAVSDRPPNNEIVVDGRGNTYVNGGGFDLSAGRGVQARDGGPPDGGWITPSGSRRRRLPQRHGGDARQLDADRRRVLRTEADGVRHSRRRHPLRPPGLGRSRRRRPRRDLPGCRRRCVVRRCPEQAMRSSPRRGRGRSRRSRSTVAASRACSVAPTRRPCS